MTNNLTSRILKGYNSDQYKNIQGLLSKNLKIEVPSDILDLFSSSFINH